MSSQETEQTVHVLIKGRVQGVGFRYFTQQRAFEIGISGWVRNLRDGRVEAVGRGAPDEIERWLEALKRGPALGRVDSLTVDDHFAEEVLTGFEIRHTA